MSNGTNLGVPLSKGIQQTLPISFLLICLMWISPSFIVVNKNYIHLHVSDGLLQLLQCYANYISMKLEKMVSS